MRAPGVTDLRPQDFRFKCASLRPRLILVFAVNRIPVLLDTISVNVQQRSRREPGVVSSDQQASRLPRIGCSGWNYPHWRAGVFYPSRLAQRHWLTYYAERFDTVELNTTFYRLPQATSVARWVSETPPGFTFAVKVSRYMTHIKRLTEVSLHLSLLYERIEPLLHSPKLGPLLWQLPPNYRYDPDRLESTLEHLHDGRRPIASDAP